MESARSEAAEFEDCLGTLHKEAETKVEVEHKLVEVHGCDSNASNPRLTSLNNVGMFASFGDLDTLR